MLYSKPLIRDTTKLDRIALANVMELLDPLDEYVRGLPDKNNCSFQCHSVCRAISMHLPVLKVVDGQYFGLEVGEIRDGQVALNPKFCDHSWLMTPDGSIIDPYPVAVLACNPILILNKGEYKAYGGGLYLENPKIGEKLKTQEMYRSSQRLARIIQKAKKLKENIPVDLPAPQSAMAA